MACHVPFHTHYGLNILLRNLSKRRKGKVQFIQKIGQKRFGIYAIVGLTDDGVDAEKFLPDFLNKLNFTFASFGKISQQSCTWSQTGRSTSWINILWQSKGSGNEPLSAMFFTVFKNWINIFDRKAVPYIFAYLLKQQQQDEADVRFCLSSLLLLLPLLQCWCTTWCAVSMPSCQVQGLLAGASHSWAMAAEVLWAILHSVSV